MASNKEYVKLWLSYEDYFMEYDDASIGRIVRAMIAYRKDRTLPSFTGPEKFIWPAIQRDINEGITAMEATANACRENGKSGGRPKNQVGSFETKENQKNLIGFSETKENLNNQAGFLESKKSQGQGQGKGQGQGQGQIDSARPRRFTPPTLAEVQSYVAERHSPVDPQSFIDFYESKGWMVGKTPMKDWKAACRNAEKWDRWDKKPQKSTKGLQCCDSDDVWGYV